MSLAHPRGFGVPAVDRYVGTIATIQGPFAFGPRPYQPTNVLDVPEYDTLDDSAERAKWRQAIFLDRRYARCPVGPILEVPSYDGQYPDTDWTTDQGPFLARMQELIDAGGVLNFHAIPDTHRLHDGTPDYPWMDAVLKPIYQGAAFQSLFGGGEVTIAWEPIWVNATWVKAAKWVRSCFPNAWIWVHCQPDHSAPGDSSEPEGWCWQQVAPYVNGFRFQSALFGTPDYPLQPDGTHSKLTALQGFLREIWDICRRFATGYAGWPTTGYGGKPLVCEAAEYLSTFVYHGSATEAQAVAWGYALQTVPAFRDGNTGDWIDLAPYRPLLIGDGAPTSL